MSVKSGSSRLYSETVKNHGELNPIDHTSTPRCEIHENKEAESICEICDRKICGLDMVKSGTMELCNRCFEEQAGDSWFGHMLVWPMFIVPIGIVILLFMEFIH